MTKIFRNIRQSFLSEGKTSNYFKYAIGEILLVMIGILLALEVSNWSDERKEEKLELALLAELVENLNDDMKDLEENTRIQQGAIRGANIVLIHFENNLPYPDSLKKHFSRIALEPPVLLNKTAYSSLVQEGMRIVKNDSLRRAISIKYESDYKFLERFNENQFEGVFQHHREINLKYFRKFMPFKYLEPVHYEQLRKDELYINYLYNTIGWLETSIRLYDEHIQADRKLIEAIKRELKKRG